MGKQYLNGVLYGGVTITGDEKLSFSVDYSTVLFSNYVTTWSDSLTYTATQDCIAYVAAKSDGSSSVLIYVNGNIAFDAGSVADRQAVTIFLKKGDIISKRVLSGSSSILVKYDIYPIIYKTLHDYSNTEKVIGTWINGKPLYEITKMFPHDNAWDGKRTQISHGISNIDVCVDMIAKGFVASNGSILLPCSRAYADAYTAEYDASIQSDLWIDFNNFNRTSFGFILGSGYTNYSYATVDVIATFRYTKTTD